MLTNLRNAFDGQIMTFNPKYGKTRSGIFGRSMVTTNMSSDEVVAGVGNRRSEEIARTGLKRFPTWIYLRQPPPFPGSKKYRLNKADCEYLFHLNIQSMVKLLLSETDRDRVLKTVDGAQFFFEKMAVLDKNDLMTAFDNTGDSGDWPRSLHSLTFSTASSMCRPMYQLLGFVDHLLSVMSTHDYFHSPVEPYEQIDSDEFIQSGKFAEFLQKGRSIRKSCIEWRDKIENCQGSSDINELKEDFELDTQNLYARLEDLDHIINGKYASFSLEGY